MYKALFFSLLSVLIISSCGDGYNQANKKPKTSKESSKKSPKAAEKTLASVTVEQNSVPAEQMQKAKELIDAAASDLSSIDAKGLFKKQCAICHGFKGNLMINGAKDLTKSNISLAESVAQVYFGKGTMTPFKGILSDEEIVAVAQYTETLRK